MPVQKLQPCHRTSRFAQCLNCVAGIGSNEYGDHTPAIVLEMRQAVGACDLLIIATPEYAHGIPGILKNGLEWLFCDLTQKKPVAVIIGSAQGQWVQEQILEVLVTMEFSITAKELLIIRGARGKVATEGVFLDPVGLTEFEEFLRRVENNCVRS